MTGSLRIVHAIASDRFAGVEQFVRRLAARQAEDGHSVIVLGGAREQMASLLASAGAEWMPSATLRETFGALRRAMPSADVVNTHMTAADVAAAAARATSRSTLPIISTRHFAQQRGTRGPDAAYRVIERRMDAEISISRAVAASIKVPSTVIHPGVDPRSDDRPAVRGRTVLVAQRLQPEKHTDVAVRAFAASRLADDGWALEIAGTGPDADTLAVLASDLGVASSVRFLGFRDDLPQLMATAGMLFASSPFEHFGLTVLEGMASGVPVVAAAAAGHSEMLDGIDDRQLFAPGDAGAAAERLRLLADDPAGRASIGAEQQIRQRREFTLRAQSDATELVYRRALETRGVR